MTASLIATHAEETHRQIKALNKRLATARGVEKSAIEAEIKAAKDAWWVTVAPLMVRP